MGLKMRIPAIFGCALMLCIATGCKPSEKNYRMAYETAQQARQAEREANNDLGIPELIPLDGPRREVCGADTVAVKREALTLHGDAPSGGIKKYNVAVGKYKMTANARGDADALRSHGFDAFVMATPGGEFFAMAGSENTMEEAVTLIKRIRKIFPERPFVGLPSEPVIEIAL